MPLFLCAIAGRGGSMRCLDAVQCREVRGRVEGLGFRVSGLGFRV